MENERRLEMMIEDQRSRLAEDYLRECEAWHNEALDMKARAARLKLGDAFFFL